MKQTHYWTLHCRAGSYCSDTLWGLFTAVLAHRWWHWRRGDGWVD